MWKNKATPMNVKPILFNTQMTRAILDDRKTATRRIAFPCEDLRPFPRPGNPNAWWYKGRVYESWESFINSRYSFPRCKYELGNILWVRETWNTTDHCGLFPNWPSTGDHYMYLADAPESEAAKEAVWRPSIHMPKEAARLFLQVENVRLERLQDITPQEIMAEGLNVLGRTRQTTYRMWKELWDGTIKKSELSKFDWNANPWVWVIEFEHIDRPENIWADYCGKPRPDATMLASEK